MTNISFTKIVRESYYKRGDGFVSTTTFDDSGVLSSDYIIQRILTALNLQGIGPSTYQTSITPNGVVLRLRVSDHGVNLSTWYAKNKDVIVPLKDSNNVAITILPNRQECEREKIPFPPKAINKTTGLFSGFLQIIFRNSDIRQSVILRKNIRGLQYK